MTIILLLWFTTGPFHRGIQYSGQLFGKCFKISLAACDVRLSIGMCCGFLYAVLHPVIVGVLVAVLYDCMYVYEC